ncbi:MAG: YfhO family protein [Elusimicrobia bacterium]|nr:YfhO family protein [Elusimicrobiota bacterium]
MRTLGCAAVVVGALAWRRLLLEGLVPMDGNVLCVTFPNWRLARSLWVEGGLPLWNPLRNMGTPYLADPITSALYPVQWLLTALPDFADFMRTWVVAHTLLAGFFWAALARRWYGSREARAVLLSPEGAAAALVGTLNAFFMVRVVFPHNLAAASWLPVVLYFQAAGSWMGMGVAFACQWLAGYPSFSIMTVLASLGLALAGGRDGVKDLARAGCAALGLAAVQFLPFLEFLAHSSRGVVLKPEYAAQFSIPFPQLLKSLLVPQWYLLRPGMTGDPAMVCFYVGAGALALAAWGTWKGGLRERLTAVVVAACLLASLGAHLPGYRHLHFLHLFRFPNNWLLLAAGGLTLLAAAGTARIRSRAWAWAAVAAVGLDLLVFAQPPKSAWARPEFLTDTPALANLARTLPPGARILHTERLMRLWSRGTLETPEDYLLMKEYLAPSYGMAFGLEEVSDFQTMRLESADRYRARLAGPKARPELREWAGIGLVVDINERAARVGRGLMSLERGAAARPRLFASGADDAVVRILDRRPGRAAASVTSPKPVTLVFSEMHYPGWRVRVDSAPARLERWEDAFMAVSVPAGTHEVAFAYGPASFRVGLAVTALTALVLLAVGRRSVLGGRLPRARACLLAAAAFAAACWPSAVRDPRASGPGRGACAAEPMELQDIPVKPGDTLWSIANTWLKDPKRWDEILKHNRLPSKDPAVALPGMVLKVPNILIKPDLRAAKVVQKKNNVLFRRRDTPEWKPADVGLQLLRDDAVRTLEDSMTRVNFIDQGILQVDANSMAIIRPIKKDYDVFLRSGGVFVGRAKVVTVSAEITPRTADTSYAAQVKGDLSTQVKVYKGRATVKAQGKSVDVDAGMATEVRLGATPSAPFKVPDLPDFEARGAEFTGDFRVVRAKHGLAEPTTVLTESEVATAARIEDIYVDVANIRVGMPLMGYHVQFSYTQDFGTVLWEKTFEVETKIRPADVKLGPGRYWVRLIPIDLLGARGTPRPPKLYVLGAATLTAAKEYSSGVLLLRPALDNDVSFSAKFRVLGRARENLSVMVNGKRVRLDEEGNFSMEVGLSPGENVIRVTTIDPKGNTDFIQRIVKYQP